MVNRNLDLALHGPKSGPPQKVTRADGGTDMRNFGSVGPACS